MPQLWAALLDSVGTDAVRVHTAASIESGKQGFFGPGQLNAAAKVVTDWHQQVLHRCRLYHFSASLWAHALDCEADWPEPVQLHVTGIARCPPPSRVTGFGLPDDWA